MSVTTSTPSTPDAQAAAWFSEMLLAAARGEYQDAAAAQRALRDLGWRVERIKAPRTTQLKGRVAQ
jgi:hypothetical protein